MLKVDFKEIPPGNTADGQDQFELFARDFLDILTYDITTEPNRGSDGGRDFIVTETRRGIGGVTYVRWLVSCKHHAHSGTAVSPSDELNITDRLAQHRCQGFIGFYSTIASSSLAQRLEAINELDKGLEFQLFDGEKIHTRLLSTPEMGVLISKYFPVSFEALSLNNLSINLAMSRFGRPYPLTFQHPNEERVLTATEAIREFPEGNQYGFNPWSGEMFLFNNILGITKVMRGKELVDPSAAELDYLNRAMEYQIESIRQHMHEDQVEKASSATTAGE